MNNTDIFILLPVSVVSGLHLQAQCRTAKSIGITNNHGFISSTTAMEQGLGTHR